MAKAKRKPKKIKVYQCSYVKSSDVFAGLQLAWEAFSNSDPDCSWGDNNRTMVTEDVIRTVLDNVIPDDYPGGEAQIAEAITRLKALPRDVYIDLEN